MNKDEYYDWIAENDTYPEHSHKWIVGLYTPDGGRFDMLHRYFGPLKTNFRQKSSHQNIEKNIQNQDLFQVCECFHYVR